MNKIFLSIFLLGAVVLLGGCGAAKQLTASKNAGAPNGLNAEANRPLDMPKGAVTDLVVGKKISAMGIGESGGVINASQIIVGIPAGDMAGLWGGPRGMASGTMATGTRFNGGTPNPQMRRSSTQQQQRTGGFGGNGGGNNVQNAQRPARTRNTTRTTGEIIKIDSNNLVLKADDGGSRVVYFTEKTEIYIFKAPAASSTPK